MRVILMLSLLSLLCLNAGFGQTEFSLYRLHRTLPQSNMLNPAFAPGFKLVIGLPVISSVRVSADLDSVAFADLFTNSGEYLNLDTASISAKMKEVNHIRFNKAIQLFYLGMTFGKSYVSIGLHEVSDLTMKYPGDLVGWAIRGPGHSQYEGRPLDLGRLYGKGMAYNKTSISLGRSFGERLRLGARFNLLLGRGMAESTKLSGKLIVGIDSVAVQTGAIQVITSGIDFFTGRDRDAGDYLRYFVKTSNRGVAWDFGATCQITRKLSASAAVNNIGGYINWQDYTRSYQHAPVTYTYRGIDILDYVENSGEVNIDDELDSVRALFKPTETIGEKYTSRFIGKGYAGINYHLFGINHVNAILAFDLLRDNPNPTLSLGYTMQLEKRLNATIGITFRQGKIDNIGAGLALRLSRFQIFATSERTQSMLYPSRATRADIHTGLNLVFGNLRDDAMQVDETGEPKGKNGEPLEKKSVEDAGFYKTKRRPVNLDKPKRQKVRQEILPPAVNQPQGDRAAEERPGIVKSGGYRNELSHIVVVGTFISRDKADRYGRKLRQEGIANKLGYDSETSVYRVYVYRSRDLKEARRICRTFRKNGEFKFAGSWVLSIVDSKFD
jgi:hypothetical protein